jgi:hypothetical protein
MGVMKRMATRRQIGTPGLRGRGMTGVRYPSSPDIAIGTSQFFDRDKVIRRLDRVEARVLNRTGAYARLAARKSIKRVGHARKEPKKFSKSGKKTKAWVRWFREVLDRPASAPGTPPFTHTGQLRRAIVYGYDAQR